MHQTESELRPDVHGPVSGKGDGFLKWKRWFGGGTAHAALLPAAAHRGRQGWRSLHLPPPKWGWLHLPLGLQGRSL